MNIFKVGGAGNRSIMGARILSVLGRGPQTITSIGASTGYDFGQIVATLRKLRDAGIVRLHNDGRWSLPSHE